MITLQIPAFSNMPPTDRGWYWLNEGPKVGTRLVWVGQRPGHAYLCIEDEPSTWTGKRNFRAVDKMPDATWSGPFELPRPY